MPKRKHVTIDHPIFGTLELDPDAGGTGHVRLPRFAQYDDATVPNPVDAGANTRRMRQHQRRAEQFAAGLFPLYIVGLGEDGPTTGQEAAFRFLVDHEGEVVDAVMTHVFRTYAEFDQHWTLDGLQRDRLDVDLSDPDDLKRLIRLSTVLIQPSGDERADVTFYFNSVLDEEHGVEVTTNQAEIIDDVPAGVFPFGLPSGLDPTDIAPEAAGHRLVEFKHRGKWRGIYVLDDELRCAGSVASSFSRASYRHQVWSAHQIEDVRAATRWRRWFASPARMQVAGWVTASNWLVSLPCLLLGWAFWPQLLWVAIILSGLCLIGLWLLDDELRLLPIVQIAAATAGLVYAARSPDFGSQEHTTQVVGVYGSIVWWGVLVIDAFAGLIATVLLVSFNRTWFREGLVAMLPLMLFIVTLTSGLVACHFEYWSSFHLLWLTPLALVASIAIPFVGIFTSFLDFSRRCPECGEPLRTAKAKQCLECGADWH